MKLHQLQALIAVADHGGIRAAARALHLSQAAVTKTLGQLEEECGTALLLRRSRGVDLTAEGERLLLRARLVVRQMELAKDDLLQARGVDGGEVRVGITPFLTLTVLGEAFHWFRQRYKNVRVQTIEGLMSRVLPRLRDGTLDFALVAADVGELDGREFASTHVLNTQQRIVAREGHPALKCPTAKALMEYEWVFTQPIVNEPGNRLAAMFTAAGVGVPVRALQCESMAALALMRSSDVLGVCPEPMLGHPESRGIVVVPTTQLFPCAIEVSLLSRPEVPLSPAAEYFAQCLLQAVAAKNPPRVLRPQPALMPA